MLDYVVLGASQALAWWEYKILLTRAFRCFPIDTGLECALLVLFLVFQLFCLFLLFEQIFIYMLLFFSV